MRTRLFAVLALPLFLAHCSEPADDTSKGGGGTGGAAGSPTGGSAGATAATGGSATGGAAGSNTGGVSGTAGTSTGGASGAAGSSGAGAATGGSGGESGAASGAGGAASGAGGAGGAASGAGGAGGASGGMAGRAGSGGQSGTGGGGAFTLTSTAIMEGAMFPAAHTCAGANTCPPLTWTAGPSGTLSYAVSLVDMSNMLEHWVIWDIPPTVTMIENVPAGANPTMPAGAKQRGFGQTANAYGGPCPRGTLHTYVFTVYALDVATLTGVTTTSSGEDIIAAIVASTPLAQDTLSGQSSASPP